MITTLNTSAHDLRAIPDGSVHAVMTSPPYYGLRSYAGEQDVEWPTVVYRLNEFTEPVTVQGCEPGCAHEWVDGPVDHKRGSVGASTLEGGPMAKGEGRLQSVTQGRYCLRCGGWRGPLGLEPSPVAFVGHLILCLREWRRVLRDDGVVFVNLGDSYAGSGGAGGDYSSGGLREGQPKWKSQFKAGDTVKPKDLLGIPWMFAFAARADGWYLRSEIIWAKPNSMPESVTDRPTKAHEQVFLLAKSSRYYWDADAVTEANAREWGENNIGPNNRINTGELEGAVLGRKEDPHCGLANTRPNPAGRNIRTVWTIATRPYAKAHYAVWPETLVEPMILASTSARGCCPQCGAGWRRVVERTGHKNGREPAHVPGNSATKTDSTGWKPTAVATNAWEPSCDCNAGEPIPCTVLDPFAGSGTTGRVAVRHRRAAILCDISGEYLEDHVPDRTTVQMRLGVVA